MLYTVAPYGVSVKYSLCLLYKAYIILYILPTFTKCVGRISIGRHAGKAEHVWKKLATLSISCRTISNNAMKFWKTLNEAKQICFMENISEVVHKNMHVKIFKKKIILICQTANYMHVWSLRFEWLSKIHFRNYCI